MGTQFGIDEMVVADVEYDFRTVRSGERCRVFVCPVEALGENDDVGIQRITGIGIPSHVQADAVKFHRMSLALKIPARQEHAIARACHVRCDFAIFHPEAGEGDPANFHRDTRSIHFSREE
ncbi:hypothetical protein [Methylococcus sp. Mc7]|uniref:hypothetical protein n=1 Tax=Methylococcus sp. Mc7 TaxID=2860258 RepID=UPI00210753F5|nr:hypothetical protein [Methylococcus sp. Mc7]